MNTNFHYFIFFSGYNRYIPPNYDGRRSLNSLAGKPHGLGPRARKSAQGILIVRFESPLDFRCNNCDVSVAKGQRFNAEKKKVGFYYTTPIWEFRIRCRNCDNVVEIRTDPKNTRYVIENGGTEKVVEGDESGNANIGNNQDDDDNVGDKTESNIDTLSLSKQPSQLQKPIFKPSPKIDAFASLERKTSSSRTQASRSLELQHLYDLTSRRWHDSYAVSRKLRDKFRREKEALQKQEFETQKLKDKMSLFIDPIVEESVADVRQAEAQTFRNGNGAGNGDGDEFMDTINNNGNVDKLSARDSIMTSKLFNSSPSPFLLPLTIPPTVSSVSSGASTPLAARQKRATDRWKYKEMALKRIATQVDKAADPFFMSSSSIMISKSVKPVNAKSMSTNSTSGLVSKKRKTPSEPISKKKRPSPGLVNYSDSE